MSEQTKSTEIISAKPSMDYPIITNIKLKDVLKSKSINKLNYEIIKASYCYQKIKDRKGEELQSMNDRYGNPITDNDGNIELFEPRQIDVIQYINKSILDAGLSNSWEEIDIAYLITSVLTDVLMDFSHLTTQEVGIAFKKGSREEYGKNYGISARAYYSWLRTYCNETKLKANKSLLALSNTLQQEETISEEEIQGRKQRWLNLIYDSYNQYKETGEYKLYDTNNMLYNLLKERGLINFADHQRKTIWNEAKEQVKQMHNPLEAKDKFQRNSFFHIIRAIKNNDDSMQGKITSQAKHIGLKIYLTELSKKKKTLKEIIDNVPNDK